MKLVLNILGILCLPVGAIWTLQGFNIMRGSVMSGHRRWIAIGLVLLVAGVIILILNNRRRGAARLP
ncbi:MAG TPA: hypothetical protein VFL04_05510 [Rectinemataceae bacterium]|nr:hypothetical protein [Rectinemataceae bacterium]